MLFSLEFDHLVIAARSLEEGAAYVEAVLGVRLSQGGAHPHMGTHNLLLSLGPKEYLEVIAIDPDAAPPSVPRWFDLDRFSEAPRMTHWVCRTDDLDEAVLHAPQGTGSIFELSRGAYAWAMAIPPDGRLPFEAAMPALIEWEATSPHPAKELPDLGLRLSRLDVFLPDAARLNEAFPTLSRLDHVDLRTGPEKRLIATIETPEGTRVLA
ncbi:MAG: VOC family protein [Pseudomonadota bacterium]